MVYESIEDAWMKMLKPGYVAKAAAGEGKLKNCLLLKFLKYISRTHQIRSLFYLTRNTTIKILEISLYT